MAKAAQGPGGPNGSEFKAALAKCTKCTKAHMKQIIAAGQDNAASTELNSGITWSPCGFQIGPHSYSQYCGYHCVGSNCIIKEYKDGKTGRITYPVT